jgi:hypothetical protein
LEKEVERLQAEVERLQRRAVHCPDCGGDYAATGLEVGCSCKLRAEVERLNARVKDWESAYQAQKERADYLQSEEESNAN